MTRFLDAATRESDQRLGPYYRWVLRPASVPVATLFLSVGVTANQATLIGMAVGGCAAVLAAVGTPATLAWAGLLWQASRVLDLVQAVPGHTEAASDTPAYASLARQAVAGLEWLDRNAGLPGVVAAIALGAPLAWLLPTLALRSVLAFAGLGGAVWVGVHRLEVRRG
jgi:hypothetical protein